MAIIGIEGFDVYANWSQLGETGWLTDNAGITVSTTAGRYGGGAVSYVSTLYGIHRGLPTQAYGSTLIVSFAYKRTNSLSVDKICVFTSDTGLSLGHVGHDYTGRIHFEPQTGNQVFGTSKSVLLTHVWNWVEIKCVFGTTASNGSIVVKVNGVEVLNGSSIDTNGTGTGPGGIELQAAGAASTAAYIDDVIIMDGTGSAPYNDFLGDCVIETLSPDGDGGTVNWTASAGADYQCVDETPNAANDDTDYISSNTVAQESRFTLANLSTTPTGVYAVAPRIRAKKDNAGSRTLRTLINSSATEATGTEMGLTTIYRWLQADIFTTDPNTAGSWSATSVNALQAGVEIVS